MSPCSEFLFQRAEALGQRIIKSPRVSELQGQGIVAYTFFFFVTTGREVLLASSGEKLGGAAKHLTAQRTAPQQRISSPQHRQLRLRKPPCWRVTRVLAQLTRRALPPLPFFPLGFQDTTPVMSPPATLVCPPVTSVSPPQCPNF